ncbi:MAG TPA: response regulator transcription factor [Candidatus Dormibacteraeota bacterium]|jgi:DNA-binding NarL/FixJ family response regulator|nr:response regulator transcription factor [Candidatus Dormibacteraeota bacterium]
MNAIRVLIADDHVLVRAGTRQVLEQDPNLRIVAEADRGDTAVELALKHRPDIALLDLRLPGITGIEAADRILAVSLATRVIILSAFDEEEYVSEALRVGASGYLVKTIPSAQLIDAVRRVHAGEVVVQPELAAKLVAFMRRSSDRGPDTELSPREREVLQLLARGASNKQIANQMAISLRTVEGHLSHIFAKLQVSSRTEALVAAISQHLVDPAEGGR